MFFKKQPCGRLLNWISDAVVSLSPSSIAATSQSDFVIIDAKPRQLPVPDLINGVLPATAHTDVREVSFEFGLPGASSVHREKGQYPILVLRLAGFIQVAARLDWRRELQVRTGRVEPELFVVLEVAAIWIVTTTSAFSRCSVTESELSCSCIALI